MEATKKVEEGLCANCDSTTWTKRGTVVSRGIKKYTREICKKGCGYIGPRVLEDGTLLGQLPINAKTKE